MSDKNIINLEQAQAELKQAIDKMTKYQNMSNEELMEHTLETMLNTIDTVAESAKNMQEIMKIALDLLEAERERTSHALSKVEQIENDLMEKGIFVGAYNLDDIDDIDE